MIRRTVPRPMYIATSFPFGRIFSVLREAKTRSAITQTV
jgi:hypothetical protein